VQRIPVIIGATASGKSDLGVLVACALRERGTHARIITADAYQIYRGMDIGTAKPSDAERAGIAHELIDIVDPSESLTAHDWLLRARACIDACLSRGEVPIVVGGTHLYIKLLVDGMFEGPKANEALRARLHALPPQELRAMLERIDPASARKLHPNDIRRTVRAIEVWELTGKAISEHQQQWSVGTPALRAGSHAAPPTPWLGPDELTQYASVDRAWPVAGFVPRDPYPPGIYGATSDLTRHKRYLPHLALPGATYFVTWKTMGDRQLSPKEMSQALDAMTHFDGTRCQVYAANVMTTHVHWVVRPFEGTTLHDLVAGVKRFSARQSNAKRDESGSLWEADCVDHIVRDGAALHNFVRYCANNPVEARVVRAAGEYAWTRVHHEMLGPAGSQTQDPPGSESRATQLIVVDWPVPLLNRRINARVKRMMERGLLEEVRALHARGALGQQAREALGYKQLIAHLQGRCPLQDSIEETKIATRHFAKAQRTWLKKLAARPDASRLDMTQLLPHWPWNEDALSDEQASALLACTPTPGQAQHVLRVCGLIPD
jgi:tRNA A37 N6-isopentenylltransferase MiaA